jgi:hypothetical protein
MQDKRASKLKTFHDTLKDTAHTPRWIRQPIVHIVELWLADAPLINVTTIHKPHDITTVQRTLFYAAIQEQGRIGWYSFVRGRISTKWAKAIAARYQAEDREYFQRHDWTRRCIRSLWTLFENLWLTRNSILHGVTLTKQQTKQKQALVAEIQDAFLHGHYQLHPNDLTLLDRTSAQQILDSTLQYQEKWLASFHQARRRWLAIEDGRLLNPIDWGPNAPDNQDPHVQTRLHRYFPRTTQPPEPSPDTMV